MEERGHGGGTRDGKSDPLGRHADEDRGRLIDGGAIAAGKESPGDEQTDGHQRKRNALGHRTRRKSEHHHGMSRHQSLDDLTSIGRRHAPVAHHADTRARDQIGAPHTFRGEFGEGAVPGVLRSGRIEIDHERRTRGNRQAQWRERAEESVLRGPDRNRRNGSRS